MKSISFWLDPLPHETVYSVQILHNNVGYIKRLRELSEAKKFLKSQGIEKSMFKRIVTTIKPTLKDPISTSHLKIAYNPFSGREEG